MTPNNKLPSPLSIPQLSVPPADQSATFQHTPRGPLQREWEPGCQPDEVYAQVLSSWRNAMRLWLVNKLKKEKEWFPAWQASVRTARRDAYFYWTAVFGSEFRYLMQSAVGCCAHLIAHITRTFELIAAHTFFVALLPMFFFFGDPVNGRG
jgi:hypothetical protein